MGAPSPGKRIFNSGQQRRTRLPLASWRVWSRAPNRLHQPVGMTDRGAFYVPGRGTRVLSGRCRWGALRRRRGLARIRESCLKRLSAASAPDPFAGAYRCTALQTGLAPAHGTWRLWAESTYGEGSVGTAYRVRGGRGRYRVSASGLRMCRDRRGEEGVTSACRLPRPRLSDSANDGRHAACGG